MGLPSIWVLVAVSVGGSLFGVAGMLLFIPLLSTVYALVKENANKKLGIVTESAPVTSQTRKRSLFGKKEKEKEILKQIDDAPKKQDSEEG